MKYLLYLLLAIILSIPCHSNAAIIRNGNTFIEDTTKVQPVRTPYTYKDKKGNIYPIYKSPKGKYYIVKTSKKTGKQYKQYIKIEP